MEIAGLVSDLKLNMPIDLKNRVLEFRVGQVLKAIAEGGSTEGLLKLRVGQQLLTAHSRIPVESGRQLTLLVEKAGPQPELRILDKPPPGPARSEALRQAMPRMLELAPALERMQQLSRTDGGAEELPPVLRQLVQTLVKQVPVMEQTTTPTGLRAALLQSGLFTEALLGQGHPPGPNLKSALQRFAARLRAASPGPQQAGVRHETANPGDDGGRTEKAATPPRGPATPGANTPPARQGIQGKSTPAATAAAATAGRQAVSAPGTAATTTAHARVEHQTRPPAAKDFVQPATGRGTSTTGQEASVAKTPGHPAADTRATATARPASSPLSPLPSRAAPNTPAPPAAAAPSSTAPTQAPTIKILPQQPGFLAKSPVDGKVDTGGQRQTGVGTRQASVESAANRLVSELGRQVEGALSRIQYNQLSSLPQEDPSRLVWQLDLPLRQGERLENIRLRVEEEKAKRKSGAGDTAWRVDIEFNLDPLGPMRVRIGLLGEKVSSVFWAERPDTTRLIERRMDELQHNLERVGLEVGQLSAHHGAPPQQPQGPGLNGLLDEQA